MGKHVAATTGNTWCEAGVLGMCGVRDCRCLHLDDAVPPKMGVMVDEQLLREFAAVGRRWLDGIPKHTLVKFTKDISTTDINVCFRDKTTPDLKSLFDTIVSHLTFLPVATLSPNLRKCLTIFVRWLYTTPLKH